MAINNFQDIIDSREVISRITELTEMRPDIEDQDYHNSNCASFEGREYFDPRYCDCGAADSDGLEEEEREELAALLALANEGEGSPDWQYGHLIRDSYFEDYARQLAKDSEAIDPNDSWPNNCIDWKQATYELQMDYLSVDFDGIDYWIRA